MFNLFAYKKEAVLSLEDSLDKEIQDIKYALSEIETSIREAIDTADNGFSILYEEEIKNIKEIAYENFTENYNILSEEPDKKTIRFILSKGIDLKNLSLFIDQFDSVLTNEDYDDKGNLFYIISVESLNNLISFLNTVNVNNTVFEDNKETYDHHSDSMQTTERMQDINSSDYFIKSLVEDITKPGSSASSLAEMLGSELNDKFKKEDKDKIQKTAKFIYDNALKIKSYIDSNNVVLEMNKKEGFDLDLDPIDQLSYFNFINALSNIVSKGISIDGEEIEGYTGINKHLSTSFGIPNFPNELNKKYQDITVKNQTIRVFALFNIVYSDMLDVSKIVNEAIESVNMSEIEKIEKDEKNPEEAEFKKTISRLRDLFQKSKVIQESLNGFYDFERDIQTRYNLPKIDPKGTEDFGSTRGRHTRTINRSFHEDLVESESFFSSLKELISSIIINKDIILRNIEPEKVAITEKTISEVQSLIAKIEGEKNNQDIEQKGFFDYTKYIKPATRILSKLFSNGGPFQNLKLFQTRYDVPEYFLHFNKGFGQELKNETEKMGQLIKTIEEMFQKYDFNDYSQQYAENFQRGLYEAVDGFIKPAEMLSEEIYSSMMFEEFNDSAFSEGPKQEGERQIDTRLERNAKEILKNIQIIKQILPEYKRFEGISGEIETISLFDEAYNNSKNSKDYGRDIKEEFLYEKYRTEDDKEASNKNIKKFNLKSYKHVIKFNLKEARKCR